MDSNGRRALVLGAASAALVGGTGCFTTLFGESLSKTAKKGGEVVLSDTVLALGQPSDTLKQALNAPGGVIFLGMKKTYFMLEGGDKILQCARHPDLRGDKFDLPRTTDIYIKDDKVWGDIHITYGDGLERLSEAEILALKALGFSEVNPGAGFRMQVALRGKVYPAMDLSAAGLGALKKTYGVFFREPEKTVTEPNWDGIKITSVTLALDVVTAPVQLAGLVLFVITKATGR